MNSAIKEEIDLSRLTRIYNWKDSSMDENSVFELLREAWFSRSDIGEWIESLPSPIIEKSEIKKGFFGVKDSIECEKK